MSQITLDWSTAEVHDGTLTVELDGEPERRWRAGFERTATLLGGEWEAVKLKKRKVKVDGVASGSEEELRHFLESVVQQANADVRAEQEPEPEPDEEPHAEGDADAEMTERFRAFAESHEAAG